MYLKRWQYLVFLLKISTVLAFVYPPGDNDSDEAGFTDAPPYSYDEENKVKAIKIKLDFNAEDPSKAVIVEPLDYEIPDINSNAQYEENRMKDMQISQDEDDIKKIEHMMKVIPHSQDEVNINDMMKNMQNSQVEVNRMNDMMNDMQNSQDQVNRINDMIKDIPTVTFNYNDFKIPDINSGTDDERLTFLGEYMLARILLYVIIVALVIGVPACIKFCCPNCCRKKRQGMIVRGTKSEDMQQLV